jgi:hypothetical protein
VARRDACGADPAGARPDHEQVDVVVSHIPSPQRRAAPDNGHVRLDGATSGNATPAAAVLLQSHFGVAGRRRASHMSWPFLRISSRILLRTSSASLPAQSLA